MSALSLAVVDHEAGLRDLAPAWAGLHARCRLATPFQSPAWLIPWWRAFHPGRLATLALFDGSELAALAPLYEEADGPDSPRLLPIGIGNTDLLDVLVLPGSERSLCEALVAMAACFDRGLLWTDLPPASPLLEARALGRWTATSGTSEPCPVLAWPAGRRDPQPASEPSDLPDFVPAPQRRKWRMALHRSSRRGEVRTRLWQAEEASAFLDQLDRLHGLRWQGRGEAGVLADERVRRFQRLALPGLLEKGLAEAETYSIGGQIVGAYYGLRDDASSYAYLGGFDPAFDRESPGTLLIGRAIDRAVRRGAGRFHFLRGREAYKYAWGATDQPHGWWRLDPIDHD